MRQIAVDLTPILPGGDNGGAKIMTLNLIKHIAKIAPYYHFHLLSNNTNYNEIKQIKSNNINIINIDSENNLPKYMLYLFSFVYTVFLPVRFLLSKTLKHYIMTAYHKSIKSLSIRKISKLSSLDMLFSPFTAPFFHRLNVPNISVIYDLQYRYYPFFFSSHDCVERDKTFKDACKYSSKLITISNFVKETVLENSKFPPENIQTIHIKLSKRLPKLKQSEINQVLVSLDLTKERFLLYPANFWAHKNHKMLFTAFNMYRHQNPHSTLKLVCTGTNEEEKKNLVETIKLMKLSSWIIMPGYLSDKSFSALMTDSLAIIFPSLYEGFGMPVLEAMNLGKPVLCSNVTSLPEVAGEAAVFFDPKKPVEIANAIYRIENEPDLIPTLINNGKKHVATFGTENDMAKEYLKIFDEVLSQKI